MRKAQRKKLGEMGEKSIYANHKAEQSNMHTKYDRHKRKDGFSEPTQEE